MTERYRDESGCCGGCLGCIIVLAVLALAFIGVLHVAAGFM